LIDQVHLETPFELLLPMPARSSPKLDSQPLDFNPTSSFFGRVLDFMRVGGRIQ